MISKHNSHTVMRVYMQCYENASYYLVYSLWYYSLCALFVTYARTVVFDIRMSSTSKDS